MLPKKRRISRLEIDYVVRNGVRHNSPHFLLYLSKNQLNHSRFSFSVPKKVAKTAVSRNKYRRRGYSIISDKITRISPRHDFLFVFKKGSELLRHKDIENEILGLLYATNVLV